MPKTVIGVFKMKDDAEAAIVDLKEYGYDVKNISVILKDYRAGRQIEHDTGAKVVEGVTTGITTGAIIGGVAGFLVGAGVLAIPALGAVMIAGPIAASLGLTGAVATTASGAMTGALAGGIVGALASLGLPEKEAREYEEHIRAGGTLLAVPADAEDVDDVRAFFEDNNAFDVRSIELPRPVSASGHLDRRDEEEMYANRAYAHHRNKKRSID